MGIEMLEILHVTHNWDARRHNTKIILRGNDVMRLVVQMICFLERRKNICFENMVSYA